MRNTKQKKKCPKCTKCTKHAPLLGFICHVTVFKCTTSVLKCANQFKGVSILGHPWKPECWNMSECKTNVRKY